ncbi:MAG TPA: phosphoribosyltransferase family protein [Clostridiaceae bacterium]
MGNGIVRNLKYILSSLLEVIYSGEECCVLCGTSLEDDYLCKSCYTKLKLCKGSFKVEKGLKVYSYYSGAYYSYSMMELVIRLKYKGDFHCGNIIGSLMKDTILREGINFDYITYVPISEKTLAKRGYNQSQLLAKYIGSYFNKKVYGLIYKTSVSKDQIGLSKEERWENLSKSFKCKAKICLKDKTILLIDDVITTGATAFLCAEELKRIGAKEVIILTGAKSKL